MKRAPIVAFVLLLTASGAAGAQPTEPDVAVAARDGYSMDFASHVGSGGGLFSFSIGGYKQPSYGFFYAFDGHLRDTGWLTAHTAAMRVYATDRVWFRLGGGIAHSEMKVYDDGPVGAAFSGAIGVDITANDWMSFDVRATWLAGVFESGSSGRAGIGLGFALR